MAVCERENRYVEFTSGHCLSACKWISAEGHALEGSGCATHSCWFAPCTYRTNTDASTVSCSQSVIGAITFGDAIPVGASLISVCSKRAGLNAGRWKCFEVSEPIRSWAYFRAKRSSGGRISKIAMWAIENAFSYTRNRIQISPISNGIIAFSHAAVCSVVDIEWNGDSGALGDVRANINAGHICI